MTTLLICGTKGGSGKSTLATNLAVMRQAAGHATLLVDCDKQASAHGFAQRRAGRGLHPPVVSAQLSGGQLHANLADFTARYPAVVIDCGGHDSVELRAALVSPAVTQVLIPLQASFFDLESLVAMDTLLEQARAYNPGLQACCVLNRAPSHKAITVADEAREFVLEELPGFELADIILHDRIAYGYATAAGESVIEYERRTKRNGKAAAEMTGLYEYLFKETLL